MPPRWLYVVGVLCSDDLGCDDPIVQVDIGARLELAKDTTLVKVLVVDDDGLLLAVEVQIDY